MSDHDDSEDANRDLDGQQANLGEMLRHARELRELSIENLAHRLRLEPRIIRQLENDQIDQIAAPAFTRGYVRSIAKELDVDSAPLLAMLDLRFESEPPALSDFKSRAPVQITSDSDIMRYTTIALVVATVALVVLWWQAQAPGNGPELAAPGEDSVAAGPPPEPLDYEFEIVTHPQGPLYRAEPELQAAPADDLAYDTEAEATPPADDAAPAAVNSNEIVITTSEDAWVEVRDALGAKLHYNLARPGREVRLNGQPPFALTIGNALAVSILFAGQAVDLGPYVDDGVARLQLGADAATP